MLDKLLFRYIGNAKKYIVVSVLLMMSRVVGSFLIALSLGRVLRDLFLQTTANYVAIIFIFLLGFALRSVSLYLVTRYQTKITGEVKTNLRTEMISKAMRIGPSYLNYTSTANMINMGSDTIEQLENYYGRFLPQFFGSFGMSLVTFIVLLPISLFSALLFLILAPIIPLMLKAILEMVARKQRKYWGSYQDVGQLFLDSLQGMTTLKIFSADEKRAEEIHEKSEIFRIETMNILRMQLRSITLIEWIAYGGSIALMAVGLPSIPFTPGNVAAMVVLIFMSLEAFSPMSTLTSSFHVAMTGVAAGKNLIDFFALPEQDEKDKNEIRDDAEDITINNLTFTYPGSERRVLEGVNASFGKPRFTAIVGASGSGKSTLVRLITGQVDGCEEAIYWGNRAYSTYKKQSVTENMIRISHDAHVFEKSVRRNLMMGKKTATDDELIDALKTVRLYDEIEQRGGLDLDIQSGGSNLSGGQKQRLVLARALLRNARVYVFDEATSNIDIESESVILKVMKDMAQDHIVILVSHRLYAGKDADKIYVLDDGKITEEGTFEELLARNGIYRQLWQAQARFETEDQQWLYGTSSESEMNS
ncbi:MAG TPA: ABC transporter ATP-binding protein/permease [Clostridiaceae bacterium]|nr:ABC transporter ATP-binding protein/permease [Clostridiaceae bacterium]